MRDSKHTGTRRSPVEASTESACLECDALLPAHRLGRRAVFQVAAGLAAASCSSSPKWTPKPVVADGDLVELDLKDYPELATAGGMVAVKPSNAKRPVLVMRIEGDEFRVMSLRCPHLGCTVRWDTERQTLGCPCHGSEFDDHGRRLSGPAKAGLEIFPSQRAGTLVQFKMKT